MAPNPCFVNMDPSVLNLKKNGEKKCVVSDIQLTLVISNSMGPWKKFESTVVRLKRSYGNTGSVVCLTTKGRELEQNFEELNPASHWYWGKWTWSVQWAANNHP
jgi:hypothetical protein